MFTIPIIIFIPISKQPAHNRLAENQPMAGLSCLNEHEKKNEYENGMGKLETELLPSISRNTPSPAFAMVDFLTSTTLDS